MLGSGLCDRPVGLHGTEYIAKSPLQVRSFDKPYRLL